MFAGPLHALSGAFNPDDVAGVGEAFDHYAHAVPLALGVARVKKKEIIQ